MKFASIFTSKIPVLVRVVDWLYCVGWHDMQNDNAIRDTSRRTPCLSLSRDQNNFNFYFGGASVKKANEKGQLFDTKDLQMVMRQIFWWGWTTNRERAATKLNVEGTTSVWLKSQHRWTPPPSVMRMANFGYKNFLLFFFEIINVDKICHCHD